MLSVASFALIAPGTVSASTITQVMHGLDNAKGLDGGCSVAFNSAIAARRGLSPRIADLDGYGCTIGMGSDNMSEDMVEVVRKVRTMDEGAILREAQEVATRAWRKLFESRSDLARPAGLHLGL